MKKDTRLSNRLNPDGGDTPLKRNLLSERAAESIRNYISTGRLPEGAKVTEADVSGMLGISRAPARDALKILETEGLVISRPGGRYVRIMTEKDVRGLYELRRSLETLAIRSAGQRAGAEDRQRMATRIEELEEAAESRDPNEWTRCDFALHRSIWQAADNEHLLNTLDSCMGPMFILVYRDSLNRNRDFPRAVQDHRDLVDLVSAGKVEEAVVAVEEHMDRSLKYSLATFRIAEPQVPTLWFQV